ncbi:HEPN domain-containing protein [Serratia fonticola]|uniref:HEPN domain-containing protein n=1 Tax=Serratia fonticola TaxID=47917 RepID=UPI0015C58834|nr:HEPN domain-containing protein [Serratia fonticola]NYA43253.1 HEPN domain-containing protein [Serratia fonticola]
MALNTNDFLHSAIANFKFHNEVSYRNAISRAYYSTYHKSLSQVITMPKANASHHAALIRYLASNECFQNEQCERGTLMELSRCIKKLRNERNKADYQLDTTITKENAEKCLALAHKIFSLWGDQQEQLDNQDMTSTV